jgi:hypothetical protein
MGADSMQSISGRTTVAYSNRRCLAFRLLQAVSAQWSKSEDRQGPDYGSHQLQRMFSSNRRKRRELSVMRICVSAVKNQELA